MPISIKCSLSPQTTIDMVGDLICALSGQTPTRLMHSKGDELNEKDFYSKYSYKYVTHESMPMCVGIEYVGADKVERHILYHFEYGDDGSRGFGPISNMHNVAIAKKLVTLLGGSLYYSDMGGGVDYEVPLVDSVFFKESMFGTLDEPYLKRQQYIKNIPLLDAADFQESYNNCVYKDENDLLYAIKHYSTIEKNLLTDGISRMIKKNNRKRKI